MGFSHDQEASRTVSGVTQSSGKPMPPAEFRREARKLAKKIGAAAEIWTSCSTSRIDKESLSARVYDEGMGHNAIFAVKAEDFDELLHQLSMKWIEYEEEHRKRTVRAMALAIIKITADQGACTDAALRMDFNQETIARYGTIACEDANTIASKGPFSIVMSQAANAA